MRDQSGFSLIELMVTMALLAMVTAGLYGTFGSQERAYILQDKMAEMNQNGRVALEFMSKDIRNAGLDPTLATTTGAGAGIETATATSVVFTQDTDEDGVINTAGEWLGYQFSAANERIDKCSGTNDCTNWQPFVDLVQALQFSYIYADGDDSAAAGMPDDTDADDTNDFEDIREVEIQIQAMRSGQTDANADVMARFTDMTLTSRVQVRNLALR